MVIDSSMIGAPVYDRDGHQIGTVKEIEDSAFKIDVPLAFDYWLHFDAVRGARLERVDLSVDRDHLDEFKLHSPEDDRVVVPRGTTVDSGVLRNEEIAVMGVTDWGDVSDRFREDWQSEHGTNGNWEEMEPSYHFGYEMAHDPRFHGRSFDSVEPDLQTEWITWSRRSGSMSDDSSWDRVRASVRRAFDSAHAHRRAA